MAGRPRVGATVARVDAHGEFRIKLYCAAFVIACNWIVTQLTKRIQGPAAVIIGLLVYCRVIASGTGILLYQRAAGTGEVDLIYNVVLSCGVPATFMYYDVGIHDF